MLAVGDLVRMMVCPTCGQSNLSFEDSEIRCPAGHATRVAGNSIRIDAAQPGSSAQWQSQQDIALADYHAGHGLSQGADPVARLFGGFMAVTLRSHHKVIDIGCGISGKLPDYVSELGLEAYIGLEPLPTAPYPPFPLLSGGMAEKLPLQDGVLEAVIFATSMDHIEGIDTAIAEAKRVAKPGGRIYMWIGLYDPEDIARSKTFYNVLLGNRLKQAFRLLAPQVEYAHTLWRMLDRKRRLQNNIRIDPYHCRYYTRERVKTSLETWKLKELRSVIVPGMPSMFVEAAAA